MLSNGQRRWIASFVFVAMLHSFVCAMDQELGIQGERLAFRKNVLRAHLGAASLDGGLDLRDDPSQWSDVSAGKAEWTVDLGRPRVLDRFTVKYRHLAGQLRVLGSKSLIDPQWELLGAGSLAAGEEAKIVGLRLRPMTGQYIRLSIASETSGSVRALGLFGPLRSLDFRRLPREALEVESVVRSGETDPLLFSLANGLSWARVARVSPGEGPMHLLRDEDVATGYRFARVLGNNGIEPPSFVIDLGHPAEIGRIVVLHDHVPGSWAVENENRQSENMVASGGAGVIEDFGLRAQRLYFYWKGDVPPDGFVVHEVAVFTEQGFPASQVHRASSRVRPSLPGLARLPVGGIPETGLPEIEPESP